MAITIAGKTYEQLSSCDTSTSGGTWSGISFTADDATKKQGVASLSCILKSSGENVVTFTPTLPKNLENKHLRMWILLTHGGILNTYDLNGVRFFVTGGGNTGYWKVGGRDTYPGGWFNLVIDTSLPCDAGTKPSDMTAITAMGFTINLTTAGKNAINTWFDNLVVSDGIVLYGDKDGGYFDFADVFSIVDDPSTGGMGILRQIGGIYFLTGLAEFGDGSGSSSCKFNAKSQTIVFENRRVNSNLYKFNVVDNGTGTTEFVLGEKAGTGAGASGVKGCMVRVADTAQTCRFGLIGNNANVDNFRLYGSTFFMASSITFPPSATNVEILNCNFETCTEAQGNTCVKKNCNFIGSTSTTTGAIMIDSLSHNMSFCNFINCSRAVRFPTGSQGEYTFISNLFINNTIDIRNEVASGNTVKINCSGTPTSNPSTHEEPNGGTTNIVNTKTLTLKDLVSGSEVRIYEAGTTTEKAGIENSETTFQYSYSYAPDTYVDIVVHHVNKLYYRMSNYLLPSADTDLPIAQQVDRQYYNPP